MPEQPIDSKLVKPPSVVNQLLSSLPERLRDVTTTADPSGRPFAARIPESEDMITRTLADRSFRERGQSFPPKSESTLAAGMDTHTLTGMSLPISGSTTFSGLRTIIADTIESRAQNFGSMHPELGLTQRSGADRATAVGIGVASEPFSGQKTDAALVRPFVNDKLPPGLTATSMGLDGRSGSFGGTNQNTSYITALRYGATNTTPGRQLPGIEIIMGAVLSSVAIANARRRFQGSEYLNEQPGCSKAAWLEAIIAEYASRKKAGIGTEIANSNVNFDENDLSEKASDNSNASDCADPLISALELFNLNLKEERGPAQGPAYLGDSRNITTSRKKYQVKREDNLESIAEKYFHDRRVAWLIADLNRGQTRENVVEGQRVIELFVGQTLELPTPQEVERFMRTQGRQLNVSHRLFTLVSCAADNVALMHAVLGKII